MTLRSSYKFQNYKTSFTELKLVLVSSKSALGSENNPSFMLKGDKRASRPLQLLPLYLHL